MAVRQLVCGWSSHRWGGRHRPVGGAPGAPGPGRIAIFVDGDGLRHGGHDEEEVGGSGGGAVETGNPATLGIRGIWLDLTS